MTHRKYFLKVQTDKIIDETTHNLATHFSLRGRGEILLFTRLYYIGDCQLWNEKTQAWVKKTSLCLHMNGSIEITHWGSYGTASAPFSLAASERAKIFEESQQ